MNVVAVWCRGHGCCVAMGRTPMPTVCSAPRANSFVSNVFSTDPLVGGNRSCLQSNGERRWFGELQVAESTRGGSSKLGSGFSTGLQASRI